jgi:hypothetical protein
MIGGGRRSAVSLASCHGVTLVHFRFNPSRDPVPVHRAESGPVAIYTIDQDVDDDWPKAPAASLPGPGEQVLALAFANLGHDWAPSQPCHVSGSNGAVHADCINPSPLTGTPIFNADGRLVGLMQANGEVIGADRIRAIAGQLGVPLD